MKKSTSMSVRVSGPWAIFTRPELKAERVSYPCMTPSAARGVLEAVLWKPAMKWHIDRIHVLNPIRFAAIFRNEVNSRMKVPPKETIEEGGTVNRYFADGDRAQRNTIALQNVDYVIEARFTLTDRAGREDSIKKFEEMFTRRVEKGQHFHQPYLGCRECAAAVATADDVPPPTGETRNLGIMLWDIDYDKKRRIPRFFAARLENGVMEVPSNPEATLDGLAAGGAT